MKTYRALAALLAYPEAALIEALPEIRPQAPAEVQRLVKELEEEDLFVSQERYVSLFDRSRALSLHLFEHVHGESRDRGQAMVDLQAAYLARGMQVVAHELPDYLPAFLEFLSLLPPAEAQGFLKDTASILRALGDRLAERGSCYAGVFAALLRLAGEPGLTRAAREQLDLGEDVLALDKAWMDPEVTFGPQPGVAPVRLYRNGVPQ